MGTGTGTGNLLFFLVVSEPVSEKFGTEKSPGTGLEKYLVPKKVSEPVSENFGTEKKSRNLYRSDFGSRHTLLPLPQYPPTLAHSPISKAGSSLLMASYLLSMPGQCQNAHCSDLGTVALNLIIGIRRTVS